MRDEQPDDAALRLYLLGELSESEEDQMESLLLQHDELYERCEAVEGDLLDDFESGALTAAERRRVEAWLDASPELQLRQQILRSVRSIPAPPLTLDDARRRSPLPANVLPMPRRSLPSWAKWAALAAALLVAAGLFWLESRPGRKEAPMEARNPTIPAPRPQLPAPVPPKTTPIPEIAQKEPRAKLPKEAEEELKSLGYLGSVVTTTVLDISLEVRRDAVDELQEVSLGKKTEKERKLRFLFDFPPQTDRFKVTLLDAGGSAVGSWNEVKVRTVHHDQALVVTLPSEKLPAGRYTVQAEPIQPGPDDVPIEVGFEIIGGSS